MAWASSFKLLNIHDLQQQVVFSVKAITHNQYTLLVYENCTRAHLAVF